MSTSTVTRKPRAPKKAAAPVNIRAIRRALGHNQDTAAEALGMEIGAFLAAERSNDAATAALLSKVAPRGKALGGTGRLPKSV